MARVKITLTDADGAVEIYADSFPKINQNKLDRGESIVLTPAQLLSIRLLKEANKAYKKSWWKRLKWWK